MIQRLIPALLFVPSLLLAQEATPPEETAQPEAADSAVVETVNVTGEFLGDRFSPDSISTAVVDLSETVGATTAIDAAVVLPGVSENGQAGLFQVLSVRGVSRQRLLTFVDGVRITSERRAGVSASFVDPELIGQVEVARGPASTYYGSGALGGAIQLIPRTYSGLSGGANYQTQGDEFGQHLSWGGTRGSVAIAHRSANDAETPDGETLFSGFDQTSGSARLRLGSGNVQHHLRLLGSYGSDIGKSSLEYPDRVTLYPQERHGILRYQVERSSDWRARLWSHAQDLVTDASFPARGERDVVESSSFDLGGLFEHRLPIESDSWDGRVGVDYFGRRDVSSEERNLGAGSPSVFRSLNGAEVDELAAYSVVNWSVGGSQFEAGARLTEGHQRLGSGSSSLFTDNKRERTAVTGFLGASIPLNDSVALVGNVGRGIRFPSLTEQFFVGTTGRGQVQGNPDLQEETSTNVELSVRILGRRSSWTVAAYRDRIEDYVERVDLGEGLLTFENLVSGRIIGIEVHGFHSLSGGDRRLGTWRLEGSGHWIDGESSDGTTLSDVPANRIRGSVVHQLERWTSRLDIEYRFEKDEFGPAERAVDSAVVVDGRVSFALNDRVRLALELENLLDEEYFPAADDRAPLAAGRSVGLSVRFSAK